VYFQIVRSLDVHPVNPPEQYILRLTCKIRDADYTTSNRNPLQKQCNINKFSALLLLYNNNNVLMYNFYYYRNGGPDVENSNSVMRVQF